MSYPPGTPLDFLFSPVTVYTFVDGDTNEPTHINVTGLSAAIKRFGLQAHIVEIGDTLIDALRDGTLGVEEEHALKLPDEALEVPAIVCSWGDTHIIADGIPGDGAFWDDFNRNAKVRT